VTHARYERTFSPWSLKDFTPAGYDKGRSVFWQAAWFATMNLVFIKWWCPRCIRVRLLRAFGASIGSSVVIRHRVRILWPWKLEVGDCSWIGEGSWLLNLEPILIGTNVCVSQEAFLCTGGHDRRDPSFRYDNGPITIADNSWIATQALILRGVTVGNGVVVGARAVVTRSLPAHATVSAGDRA
jgi:putative colanic acid biosynthesis acetyltransferase WcaF